MRDRVLDIAKGIGILLVMFAHINGGPVNRQIYLFHMPLYFYLAGAALNYSRGGFRLSQRIRTIVVPYFVFSLLSFLYWWQVESKLRPIHEDPIFNGWLGGLDSIAQQFANIFLSVSYKDAFLYNVVMWFLPCLFVLQEMYALLHRYARKYEGIIIVLLALIYFYLEPHVPNLPWCFEISVVALPVFWLGRLTFTRVRDANIILGGYLLL